MLFNVNPVRVVNFRVRSTPRRPEQGGIPRRARSARRLARPKAEQVSTCKIQILVGISVLVEDSKSLLPTLGRSANLSEPWATSFLKYLAISNFYSPYVMRLVLNHIEFDLLALECGAPPGGRSTTERKAAVAQRPTPCEAEGRASSYRNVTIVT